MGSSLMPDEASAAALAVAAAGGGALRTIKTTQLITAAEGVEILKKAASVWLQTGDRIGGSSPIASVPSTLFFFSGHGTERPCPGAEVWFGAGKPVSSSRVFPAVFHSHCSFFHPFDQVFRLTLATRTRYAIALASVRP